MYADHLSGGATVRVTTGATIAGKSPTQTFTSITSNSDGRASTVVSIVVITAAPETPTGSATARKDHTPAIIGGAIAGVAAGMIAVGSLCYFLYRRHQKRALDNNTSVSSAPDPSIHKPETKHLVDAELDTHPNTIVELPTKNDPNELDATTTASPNSNNRVSAVSTGNNARWSAVSSLSPSRIQMSSPAAAVTPMAASTSAVSQQHYGAGQQSYLLVPENTLRLYRPLSGTLPAIQVSGSEISLTPGPDSAAGVEQSAEHTVTEVHGGENTNGGADANEILEAHESGTTKDDKHV
jgi:hypothetical protein